MTDLESLPRANNQRGALVSGRSRRPAKSNFDRGSVRRRRSTPSPMTESNAAEIADAAFAVAASAPPIRTAKTGPSCSAPRRSVGGPSATIVRDTAIT